MHALPLRPFEHTLREIFGGELRYRLLRVLFEEPGRELGLGELAVAAGLDSRSTRRMPKRLINAGLCEQVVGSLCAKYRARRDNPVSRDLSRLLARGNDLADGRP